MHPEGLKKGVVEGFTLRTNHSVPGRSRASAYSALTCGSRTARSRRAGPLVFRILPHKFRAEASAEGPCGALRDGPCLSPLNPKTNHVRFIILPE